MSIRVVRLVVIGAALSVGLLQIDTAAQDRLRSMAGYAQYQKIAPQIAGAVKSGAVNPAWGADGKSFEYTFDGKRYRYDVAARQATPLGEAADPAGRGRGGRGQGAPERGRQYASADSPDGTLRAQSNDKDRNHLSGGSRHQGRDRHHQRRQRRQARQVRHRELGLRRRARSGHRHLVVARQPQGGVLSLRRERRSRLLPAARSDQAAELRGHRGLSEGRRAEPDRRSPDLRRRLEEDDKGRRARRQAVHQRRRRTLRLSRELEPRRQGTAVQPHQPPPEHPRDGGRRAGERGSAGGAARRVADRLDREQPDHGVPEGQPPLHLAIRAQRLEQLLSLRSRRQADYPADHPHHVRSRLAGEGRRGGRGDVLHGARRRQSAQAAAASRRPRWPRRRPPDQSEVPPHGRLLHGRRGRRPRPRRAGEAAGLPPTTGTSSTSIRPTTRRPPPGSWMPRRARPSRKSSRAT